MPKAASAEAEGSGTAVNEPLVARSFRRVSPRPVMRAEPTRAASGNEGTGDDMNLLGLGAWGRLKIPQPPLFGYERILIGVKEPILVVPRGVKVA